MCSCCSLRLSSSLVGPHFFHVDHRSAQPALPLFSPLSQSRRGLSSPRRSAALAAPIACMEVICDQHTQFSRGFGFVRFRRWDQTVRRSEVEVGRGGDELRRGGG